MFIINDQGATDVPSSQFQTVANEELEAGEAESVDESFLDDFEERDSNFSLRPFDISLD